MLFSDGDSEKLYFYDKNMSKHIGPAGPRNFCSENYLYSLTGSIAGNFDKPTHIENPVLSTIDGNFVSEVTKLISKNPNKTDVSIYNLARFFGFLSSRHPELIYDFEERFNAGLVEKVVEFSRTCPKSIARAKESKLDLYNPAIFKSIMFTESRDMALLKMH